jgi:hypothetical protein
LERAGGAIGLLSMYHCDTGRIGCIGFINGYFENASNIGR